MDKKHFFGIHYAAILIFTLSSVSAFAATEIKSKEQKLSYAMGTYFAVGIAQQNLKIDNDAFLQAVEDVLKQKEPQLSKIEMQDILTQYQKTLEKQQNDSIAKNKKAGEAFLAANKKKEGVIESPSGLQYKVIKEGQGKKPAAKSNVTVHYEGTLINGTVFDSSYKRGEPAKLSLEQVIKGWQEALPMMKTGSKWQIYVPSKLAYGDRAASEVIGPASTLVFDIELISVN